jgi:hypothetical protein
MSSAVRLAGNHRCAKIFTTAYRSGMMVFRLAILVSGRYIAIHMRRYCRAIPARRHCRPRPCSGGSVLVKRT